MYEDICAQLGKCLNPIHDHGEGNARLSRMVDVGDPAFNHIAEVLADMRSAGVELTAETIETAVKLGRHRFTATTTPVRFAAVETGWKKHEAVVYYIRRGTLIKIGTTVRIRHRMTELMPDEILALEPGDRTLETQRHNQFTALRSGPRSEYFYPGAALQQHVAAVRQEHGAPPPSLPTLCDASRRWAETDHTA
ncbi:hypothetical protein PV735_05350 [Streptomyces turgidiscabies]|uniref:Uncharacterized protein n=1 Tax=Streptomyces turgidiscabies (strain Car8) TaxID=698760 RepID=L7F0P7_STRT8|nr:hypothetical protein [Streptomyces turgidiscabies]ELP64140.1 hypothetical protein STRTUCAR8_05576 [Streptomyces turgidiscabies Car8]MDX3492115.1 hypothetical protein [Streptomyces turgidiscabies]